MEEDNTDIYLVRQFITTDYAGQLFHLLSNTVEWHNTVTHQQTGKQIRLNRSMAYLTDNPDMYRYANVEFPAESWDNRLGLLRSLLKTETRRQYNSCLLNYYKDGRDEIRWHSDKEETLGEHPVIACVNLGATRKFWFRSKAADSKPFYYEVADGDLLVMGRTCQQNYVHAILREKEVTQPRISLTFRWNHDSVSQP